MNILQPYLSDAVVRALGWTFLHSLWIGALLSVVFLGVRWLQRYSAARTRYVTGLIFMSLVPVMVVLAFIFSLQRTGTGNLTTERTPVAGVYQEAAGAAETELFDSGHESVVPIEWVSLARTYYFEQYHSFFVSLWMMGIVLLSLNHIGGFLYTGRLRRHGLVEAEEALHRSFERLIVQSGISRPVSLFESWLVKVPMVIGYFKPVVLFPVGLSTGLSAAEIEAILAHEIAHIRRHDFLINILQSIVEVLLFFHPGVWIIGAAIREERENCCDDEAIRLSGDEVGLATALAQVELWRQQGRWALGFSGNKNSLFDRIKRIINNKTMKAQHREGNLLAIALIAGLCLSTLTALKGINYETYQKEEKTGAGPVAATAQRAKPTPRHSAAPKPAVQPSPVAMEIPDSVKETRSVAPALAPTPAWPWTVTPALAPAPALPATATLPLAGFPPFPPKDAILSANASTTFAMAPMAALFSYPVLSFGFPEDTLEVDSLRELSLVDYQLHMAEMTREMAQMQAGMAREMEKMAREMSSVDGEMARHHSDLAREMAESQREMAEDMAQMTEEMAREHAKMATAMDSELREEMMRHQEEMKRHQEEMLAHEREMREEHEKEMSKMEEEMREHEKRMEAFEKDLKAELVKDGIITSADRHLKLKINERELLINGSKQPETVYNKYKKFIKEKLGNSFDFEDSGNHEMNLTFTF